MDFIERNYIIMTDKEMAEKLNKTEVAVNSKRKKMGFKRGKIPIPYKDEEKNEIINMFRNGVGTKEIAKKFSRSESDIFSKLKAWEVFVYKNERWTDDEIKILKTIYSDSNWEEILKQIPNHSKQSIVSTACNLGLNKSDYFWKEEDIEILRKCYANDLSIEKIVEKLNYKFTNSAVSTKAYKLGITNSNFWQQWEIEFLKENYEITELEDVCKSLSNRDRQSIINKASDLGLKSTLTWRAVEDIFIKDNYLELSDYEISKVLVNRTQRAIKARRQMLGCERPVGGYGNGSIDEEGNIFNSLEERRVYDFIKNQMRLNYILCLGHNHNKSGKYVFNLNEDYEYERFHPDYVIEHIDHEGVKKKLYKPIIIEYFGLYKEIKTSDVIEKYVKKTKVKIEYYNSRDDIQFIALFPEDIKNNFKGLVEKLSSFFMSNFNIDVKL